MRNRRNVISILAAVMSLTAAILSFAGQATFSDAWEQDAQGIWHVSNSSGSYLSNAWICDDAVPSNQKDVWYLLDKSGAMVSAGLVKDGTGNYYSLETNHNGYYGMLRHEPGVYDCNGQQIYLDLEQSHNGSFAAIKNADAVEKLRAIYCLTDVSEINNSNISYTSAIKEKGRTLSLSGGSSSGGGSTSGIVVSTGKTVKEEKAAESIRETEKEEKKQPGSVTDNYMNEKDKEQPSEPGEKEKSVETENDQKQRSDQELTEQQGKEDPEVVKGEDRSETEIGAEEEKEMKPAAPEEEENTEQTAVEDEKSEDETAPAEKVPVQEEQKENGLDPAPERTTDEIIEVNTEETPSDENTEGETEEPAEDEMGSESEDGKETVTEAEEEPDGKQEDEPESKPEEGTEDEIVVPEELSFLLVSANVQLEDAKQAAVDAAIAEFKNQYITSGMTDFEKEMMIIQWMVENIAYDYDNYLAHTIPIDSTTPYGGLVKHTAVCDGYARTFEAMAAACGLTTRRIYTAAHCWNAICLDGDWYHVDVTWEDPTNGKGYGFGNLANRYINLTDEEILQSHDQWFEVTPAGSGEFEKVPLCRGTKYGKAAVAEYLSL